MGWFVTATLLLGLQRFDPDLFDPPPDPVPLCILDPEAPAPIRRISPRAWGDLPGVGPTRALALARALWRAGVVDPGGIDLTGIKGIGAITAERILNSEPVASILGSSDWLPCSPPVGTDAGEYTCGAAFPCPPPPKTPR